jgi:SagB-type dehydrogenase family enzyme
MWYNVGGGQAMIDRVSKILFFLGLMVFVAAPAGCGPQPTVVPTPAVVEGVIPLPPPNLTGQVSLEETLAQRRSVREYGDTPLTLTEIGQLLWAVQGITHERGFRTAPSAGGLYPLEVYVATADGVFHYDPHGHHLLVMSKDDARPALYEAALQQEAVRQAPAVFVVTAVYERTVKKYGGERSPRYVHLEAGHAAQNLLLEAVALGLGAVPIGAFEDERIQQVLGIPADHKPLYLIPVGHLRDG